MSSVSIHTELFNDVYLPYVDDQRRTQIFFGGSSSGKSVFLAERCVYDLLKEGRNYLVIRNVSNTIHTSVYNEIKKVILAWGLNDCFNIHKSEMTITCNNGYQVLFKGLDDVEKIKSITPEKGVITDVWVEEATETNYDDIKQLTKRLRGNSKLSKRIILSFNPIMRSHWIYEEYFRGVFQDNDTVYRDDHLLILKTTYKDNRFLSEQDVYELEKEKDSYYYNVYTLGNWGTLGNLIFTNWRVADIGNDRELYGTYKSGLDFGFTNDPTAFVRFAKRGKQIFVTHGFYEYGLTNPEIARRILEITPNAHKLKGFEAVKCDAAEPKSIFDLIQHNVNAVAAMKGPGSVNYGIQHLQQYDIVIDRPLQWLVNEFQLYQWQKNKDGEVMNIPVDKNNHGIDALRYGESDELYRVSSPKIINPNKHGIFVGAN